MARKLTRGQQAAVRNFRSRRADLRLKQRDVIDAVAPDLSKRSVESFEAGKTWPHPASLQALSRAVGWHKDYLQEFADRVDAGEVTLYEQANASDTVTAAIEKGETLREKRHRLIMETLELELPPDQEEAMIKHIMAKTAEPTELDHEPETDEPRTGTSGV